MPAGFGRFREPLRTRRAFTWVEEMFRRHRKPSQKLEDGARYPPPTASITASTQ